MYWSGVARGAANAGALLITCGVDHAKSKPPQGVDISELMSTSVVDAVDTERGYAIMFNYEPIV